MAFDVTKAQYTSEELAAAQTVSDLVAIAKDIKGPDGKLDAADFLKVAGAVPAVIALVEYITKGATAPEDDAMIAARGIGVFTAYGRGSGLFDQIAVAKPGA